MNPVSDHSPLDCYAVLGHPVAHSRSPAIHALFAQQTGQQLHYGRLDCAPGRFHGELQAYAHGQRTDDDGIAGTARGCNITVPYKFEALAQAPRRSPRAELAQAANTLRFDTPEAGGWLADNTDGVGLLRDIEVHAGVPLAGLRVLLVGAGGAAAGVLGPLLAAGPAQLVVVNRTAARADALVQRHADWARRHGAELLTADMSAPGRAYDLVINASASSLHGAASPVPASVLRAGTLAVDLMYGTAAAPFLAWAQAHGARGRDGLGMLVEQAAEAFQLWRGVRPETASVLASLRAQVDGA
jgi:shikimate dehydrogenase